MTVAELPDGLDEVAVELALEGDVAVSLTADELEYCWRELESENKAAGEIAEILGVSRRAVVRWRGGMGVSARPGKRSTLVSVRQGEPTTPTPAATSDLIETGKRSRVNRIRAIAERVERDLATLQALLVEEEARAKALQEVHELEAKLAAAKERLRPATAGHQKKRGGAYVRRFPNIDHKAVREWATANGHTVLGPGAVSNRLIELYLEAHPNESQPQLNKEQP